MSPLLEAMDSRLRRLEQAQKATSTNAGISRRRRFSAQVISSSAEKDTDETAVAAKFTDIESKSESESEVSSSSDSELEQMIQRPSRPVLKPIFIPKGSRDSEAKTDEMMVYSTSSGNREESRSMVANILRKEFEAANSSTSSVPDSTSGLFDPNCVDDSDDPANFEEEYLAWRLRELLRIREERDDREGHEREKAEIERIRNMSEEDRRKIDQEKLDEWTSKSGAQYKYLQKYYHKGAFYQDVHEDILSRDYAQPTGADRADRDVLPEIMQVREFGKKGRSKWKHLTAEDTTSFDYGWGAKDNSVNFKNVSKMGGMRGDLDNPAKKNKK